MVYIISGQRQDSEKMSNRYGKKIITVKMEKIKTLFYF